MVTLSIKKFLNLASFILLAVFALLLTNTLSCERKDTKRPFGLVNLGKIEELKRPESFLSDHNLLLRHDERGFYVMSLLCTLDLQPLKVQVQGDKQVLVSPENGSVYDLNGQVISGASKVPLPYYQLIAASGVYSGPVDSLFAKIGVEKSADWRIKTE